MELINAPGVIVTPNEIIKTTKVKKYLDKHGIKYNDIHYIDSSITDYKEIDRALINLERKLNGLDALKEKSNELVPFSNEYLEFHKWKFIGMKDEKGKYLLLVRPDENTSNYTNVFYAYNDYVKWFNGN